MEIFIKQTFDAVAIISQESNIKKFRQNCLFLMPKFIQDTKILRDELIFSVNSEHLEQVVTILKKHTLFQFNSLADITAVDYPERSKRFTVVYNLLSLKYHARIRLKVLISELTAVPSIVEIYKAAGWYEREVWDLFGIFFSNHPDLRRILTDYGFQGYPLRKDFPLSGYIEVRYDDEEKRIVSESLELSQEFRMFDFKSPWEQIYIGKQ